MGHGLRYRGNQAQRDLCAVHLLQVDLYLAHRHVSSIKGDDFVVVPGPAGLMFGDELGLEAAVAVTRHFDGQLVKIALECLLALAVAGVAPGVGRGFVALEAQVLSQLGIQGALDKQFG